MGTGLGIGVFSDILTRLSRTLYEKGAKLNRVTRGEESWVLSWPRKLIKHYPLAYLELTASYLTITALQKKVDDLFGPKTLLRTFLSS